MNHEDCKARRNRLDTVNRIRDTKFAYMESNKSSEKVKEKFLRPAYGRKAGDKP